MSDIQKKSAIRRDRDRHECTNSYMYILSQNEAREGIWEVLFKKKNKKIKKSILEGKH